MVVLVKLYAQYDVSNYITIRNHRILISESYNMFHLEANRSHTIDARFPISPEEIYPITQCVQTKDSRTNLELAVIEQCRTVPIRGR